MTGKGTRTDQAGKSRSSGLDASAESEPPIATIDEHLTGAFAFRVKVTASGALFSVRPHRDPGQPRFWCVVVVKCAPGGLVDAAEDGRIVRRNLRRDELAEIMAAIRTDLQGWLSEPALQSLRAWMLESPASLPADPLLGNLGRGRPGPPGRLVAEP